MPQVDVTWACEGDQLSRLTLSQRGVLSAGDTWPMATEVVLDYGDREPQRLRVEMNLRTTNVDQAAGKPCPRFVFANDGDFAYGRFLLDERSREEIISRLGTMRDPFLRTLLWGSLWESVREAQLDPRQYIELAAKILPGETDESLARGILARVAAALHRYVSDETRAQLVPGFERLASEQMTQSADVDLRIVWFRALQGLAETPLGLGQLKNLLDGRLWIPGAELRTLDRWNLITTLVAMDDPEAPGFFNNELQRDPGGDDRKYAYAAQAARPDADIKAQFFAEYLRTDSKPEDWIEQSLFPFNFWNQSELTAMYLTKALDALPQIKTDRKIFFLELWLDAFMYGQQSAAARDEVHRYLSKSDLDKDLRLKILESVDELDRTATIRRQFPD
jgi:aminopeptidase N